MSESESIRRKIARLRSGAPAQIHGPICRVRRHHPWICHCRDLNSSPPLSRMYGPPPPTEPTSPLQPRRKPRSTFKSPRYNRQKPQRSIFRDLGISGPVDEQVDVLVGGPPCQAFARVGRAKLRHEAHRRDEDDADIAFLVDGRVNLWQRISPLCPEDQTARAV